ncbi:MAG: hypothetical protein ACREK4_04495 [Candidatus Rokuibacteriota bacterium]
MKRPADQERIYLEAVLATYNSLPETPSRPSRRDRQLARELCRRSVPLGIVRAALILAAARRTLRSGPKLPPVRTLHYFLPAIQEVLEQPPDPGYISYLDARLRPFASKKTALLGER